LEEVKLSPLRKILLFGLKSSNVLVINNPDLKVGVRQIAAKQGFSPILFVDKYFSEETQNSECKIQSAELRRKGQLLELQKGATC
jgi:hypothetical protein